MKIDKKLVEHVAEIARLRLTNEEIKKFLPQMREVLGHFSELSKINTKGVRESFHPVELKDYSRKDKSGSCLAQEEALRNTEHKKDGYFKGPRAV